MSELWHGRTRSRMGSRVTITKADGSVEVKQAPGARFDLPSTVVRQVFARDGLMCRYCGWVHTRADRFEIDHVVPVSKGGSDDPSNLVVACFRCNRRKGDNIWVPLTKKQAKSARYAQHARLNREAEFGEHRRSMQAKRKPVAKGVDLLDALAAVNARPQKPIDERIVR